MVRLTEQALDVVEAALSNGSPSALAAARFVLSRSLPSELHVTAAECSRSRAERLATLSDEELDRALDRQSHDLDAPSGPG